RRSVCRAKLDCFLGTLDGDVVNETRVLATHSRIQYAEPDAGLYMHDRVAQTRTCELLAPPTVTESAPNDVKQVLKDQYRAAVSVPTSLETALSTWQPGKPVSAAVHLISHTINHYDGAAYVGRNDNGVGPYGALSRMESLIFTESELAAAY